MTFPRLAIWRVSTMAILLLYVTAAKAAERDIWQFEPRTGVKMNVLLIEPDNPSAAIIWMRGGKGKSNLNKNGIPDLIADLGFTVAAIGVPSDHKKGMHPNFRVTDDHVEDLDTVIGWLKDETKLPVWLVGISMGTISVANYALHGGHEIDGIALLSSIVLPPKNKRFPAVNRLAVNEITVPILAVAHKKDACKFSPAYGAKAIANAATASANAKFLLFSGGKSRGGGCGQNSHHAFFGIQKAVAKAVAGFIRLNGK